MSSSSSSSSSYQEPSELLKRLFLPPKNPSLSLSSDLQWLLFAGEPPLPSIEVLAKPEEKLAGLRLDPALWAPSRLDFAFDLTAQHLETGERIDIPLPPQSEGIRYIRFNPEPSASNCLQQFVFVSKVKGSNTLVPFLCSLNKDTGGSFQWTTTPLEGLSKFRLNFCNGCAYQFTNDGQHLLARVVPEGHPPNPPPEPISVGPSIQTVSKDARKAPGRTYQDLLKNAHDEEKFRYFLTAQVVKVDLTDTNPTAINNSTALLHVLPQTKEGKVIQRMESSPCGRFLLVEITTDLSYSVPLRRFGKDVEIWDLQAHNDDDGGGSVVPLCSIPVDDEIPLSYDACSRHPRSFTFHPCHPHTILYAHALDGGDPENAAATNGERDALYTRAIVLDDDSTKGKLLADPEKLVGLEWRFDDVNFTQDGSLALVSEYRWKDRMERLWKFQAGEKKMVWERNWQNRYKSPGAPMTYKGAHGQHFLRQTENGEVYLKGAGASSLGDRPFLDVRNLETGETKRLWRCKAPKKEDDKEEDLDPDKEVGGKVPSAEEREDVFESLVDFIDDKDTILISRESKTTPRNYYLTKLSDLSNEVTATTFPHPQPDLLGVSKELVHYRRKDGIALTANLYLPPNYDGTPRPTLFWAYPMEFKDSKAAGQVKGSQHGFVSASWASPVHWAAKGWTVMDDFALPVIGEGETPPNETFIDQIVTGTTAAVEYATQRGVTDPNRCAVGGHSYGAFMTAHLLSHTSLFAAGVGRSGAYNRTLTPMSFQSEDRSLWEAPDTYVEMSPLMHVKKYSEQARVGKMLLIHGEADENSGTHPLQSERYFAALKAFGIESRLCKLPHEGHSYRARESILHMAWEQEEWLKSL